MSEKQHPLIIVFYLDADMMRRPEIIVPFSESINHIIEKKEANAIAIFLPTNGEERVECINPTLVPNFEMERINKIIEDIKKNFSIGDDLDIEIKESKPCECGKNPSGSCQC